MQKAHSDNYPGCPFDGEGNLTSEAADDLSKIYEILLGKRSLDISQADQFRLMRAAELLSSAQDMCVQTAMRRQSERARG